MMTNNKRSVSKIRETKSDKEIDKVDDASVVLMTFIVILCFVVGIGIGYLLYIMAINGGNV